jgi:3-deoxy-D-manno-octulosonate 8-phosphate phosphatase (KDO 8-P phosphatase)
MVNLVLGSVGFDLEEMRSRAARMRLVLTDVDGTLTDGGVYYSERGEELKRFNLRDGMGIERLREHGIETAFITRESSPIVQRRAEKLRVSLRDGLSDKTAALNDLLVGSGLSLEQLAYIGDDVNDLGIMQAIRPSGLIAAPGDAHPEVCRIVHHVCARPGGHGAFREFAELIINLLNRSEDE